MPVLGAMPDWIVTASGWLWFATVISSILIVLLRRREASAAIGWSLAIVFLPGLGVLLFLVIGLNPMPARLRRKIAHRSEFSERFSPPSGSRARSRANAPTDALAQMLTDLGESPQRDGNQFELLASSRDAFKAMADAIENASHHIHIESYIFRCDDLGKRLLDLLEARARDGVEVRVIVDAIGSLASWRILRRLRRAGGEGSSFLPVRLFGKFATPHLRNHRKLLICDGTVAFVGGLNVGTEYLGQDPESGEGQPWFDLHARIEGPAVWDVQRVFVEDWDFTTKRSLDGPNYFPRITRPVGSSSIQIVTGGPDVHPNPIREAMLGAFQRARERILIATPYLVPDRAILDTLKLAARTGVDVDVFTSTGPSDSLVAHLCGESFVDELVEAGVRIHRWRPGMMHAKATVVDQNWAVVGSANLDNRSLHLNFELIAVLDRREDVEQVSSAVSSIQSQSHSITREELRAHALPRRLVVSIARLLAPLL